MVTNLTDVAPATEIPYEFSWILTFHYDPLNLFVVLFFVLALVMGTIANIITAASGFRYRKKITFKVSVEMIVLLALTDSFFCITQGLQTTQYFTTGSPLTSKCEALSCIGVFCLMLEQTLYIWIIMERIHCILWPIKHRNQCKFRKTSLDIIKVLAIAVLVSAVILSTSDKMFDIFRGRCWIRSVSPVFIVTFGIYSIIPMITSILLFSLIFYLVHSSKYTTTNSKKALVKLSAFTLVYILTSYSEFVILALRLFHIRKHVRYFLMADSIISLMSRCISPLVMIHFVSGLNIFCITQTEEIVIATRRRYHHAQEILKRRITSGIRFTQLGPGISDNMERQDFMVGTTFKGQVGRSVGRLKRNLTALWSWLPWRRSIGKVDDSEQGSCDEIIP